MAILIDSKTGKAYDTDSKDSLESAQARKLQFLQSKGQTPTLSGVDISSSPSPTPVVMPSPSTSPINPMNLDQIKAKQVGQGISDATGLYNGGKVKDPKKDALKKMRGY